MRRYTAYATIIAALENSTLLYHEIYSAVRKHVASRASVRVVMIDDGDSVDVYVDHFVCGAARSTFVAGFIVVKPKTPASEAAIDVRDACEMLVHAVAALKLSERHENVYEAAMNAEIALANFDEAHCDGAASS